MPYLGNMRFARLFQMIALLALLLAPAGMLGSHAAMAQAPAAKAGHCSEQQDHDGGGEHQQAMIDCAIACTALPAFEPVFASEFRPAPAAPAPLASAMLDGTRPEADTPPPRFS